MHHKKWKVAIVVLCVSLLTGCSIFRPQISEEVQQYLEIRSIRNSSILKVDRGGLEEYSPPKEEIHYSSVSKAVLEVVECDFTWKNRGFAKIREGDFASLMVTVKDGNDVVYLDRDILVAVGYGLFDPLIEEELIGLGAAYIIDWEQKPVSNDFLSQYSGCSIQIEVLDAGVFEEKEDAKEHLQENGYANFKEYYSDIYKMKCEELEFERKAFLKDHFFRFLTNHCEYEISSEDIVAVALQIVSTYEDYAVQLGMSLSEFYEEFFGLQSEDEFFLRCSEEAEFEIKKILAVGAIAKLYNISVEEADSSEDGFPMNGLDYERLEDQVAEYFLSLHS